MRYYWLILIILFIGCSGSSPMTPSRDVAYWMGNDNGVAEAPRDYQKFDCADTETQDLWETIYDIIGGKTYEAVYGVDTGEMEITMNPFGIKIIDGFPFEYQYAFMVIVDKDANGNVFTQTITLLVEPLDTFARRVRGDELAQRSGQIFTAGLIDTDSWLGISDRYLAGHPVTYFQFEDAPDDCEVSTAESHQPIDVTAMSIEDLTMWAAWFYPTSYDAVEDEIGGYLRVQYTYNPTGTNFVQVWEMTLVVLN